MNNLYSIFEEELIQVLPDLLEVNKKVSEPTTRTPFPLSSLVKLQLNYIPIVLDLNCYKNPRSSDNPTGDYRAAYRLFSLADGASKLTSYFERTYSVSSMWRNIVNSASAESQYVANILAETQKTLQGSQMSGMGGVPENWYLVNAIPGNWYDLVSDRTNLTRIDFNIRNLDNSSGWYVNYSEQMAIDKGSSLDKISLEVLNVEFVRPWLNMELLSLPWKIDGVEKGYFSIGNQKVNNGTFPLITRSMLVGTNLTLEGRFTSKDMDWLSVLNENLSIGPFAVQTPQNPAKISRDENKVLISADTTQVLGFTSWHVPLCPQM